MKALILGAGGFIGSHLAKRLKDEGYHVRGADLKHPEFSSTAADEFIIGDLREQIVCDNVLDEYFDEVYQLAADMGGAGYIFTGDNDNPNCAENSAYPAQPDSEYGWEKLLSGLTNKQGNKIVG